MSLPLSVSCTFTTTISFSLLQLEREKTSPTATIAVIENNLKSFIVFIGFNYFNCLFIFVFIYLICKLSEIYPGQPDTNLNY
ncbi:MAG: hypothetical protein A3F72_18375 [Bacteroidetes bacterium RIFCSPLOWO2_12_FULL_35_15]|nr:MAG: hypothetical protein A3F72_18375 [Bacteroidetes bacterium RIFCSPLOWO2_12_FULL_35_15]